MGEVTITVDDEHLGAIDQVVAALEKRGVHVTAVHSTIGIISGTADAQRASALSEIAGVISVEQAATFGTRPHLGDAT
ncbi:hypothetical protein [Williamsia sp. CHRR-6]|uniref:hypothetical protein n=1 Tax=Williamsia sp. CHRR-6 TaxID=2835871 RepID=UPI001BD9651E|nr:hypothetical protein [Williamsia sp. CHRR-6]MBT0566915.1 hypothetical protein [Williamsia sp. CHRR-6]